MKVRPAAYIEEEGKVLLMVYTYGGRKVYALPGGGPEANEYSEQTLVRELYEELLVNIEVGPFKLSLETRRNNQVTLHMVFDAKIVSGVPYLNPNQTSAEELVWIEKEKIGSLTMYPNVGGYILDESNTNPHKGAINQIWY